uniref:DUF3800 domain-containing protein n=1 Tax=Parastrongyloides trichosuri TaxID=131310 RepID=A0A0N4ZP04_PARTI
MDDLPLFDSPKLVCEGDDASVTFIVLSEKNLLTKIISNITNNQDRFNFSLGCKYFYNVIYGKPNDKKGSGELKFNLSVSLYKTFKDEKFYRYDETKVFKNVIVFNTSTGSQFIWNRCDDYLKMLTRMEYDGTPKLFKKLQRWLMLHNQLITTITLSYEMGCKVSIYKEIVCLLFEKLTNVEKVTLNANLFYTLATYYLNIVEKFSTNKNKVIIEICGDQVDKGGITRRFKLLEWLTPKHLVQLNPTNSWSLSSTQFGNPIGNMSVYKYYQKISNVSMSDIRYHFRDQIQLKEVCIRCDISERPTPYNDKIESFKNVSTFSFTSFCNHQDCILNVLSSFPTSNNSGKNYSLREVYIYCKEDFRGQKKLLNLLCEV